MCDDYYLDDDPEDADALEDEPGEYDIYYEQHITRQIKIAVACDSEELLLQELEEIGAIMLKNPEYTEKDLFELLEDSPYLEVQEIDEDYSVEKEQPEYLEHSFVPGVFF